MNMEIVLIASIVGMLAVIQSIFGLGILVFGTPTLLLLGLSFPETLSHLLPASVAVSGLQAWKSRSARTSISAHLFTLCLPGIAIGLWSIEFIGTSDGPRYMVGAILLLSAVFRVVERVQTRVISALSLYGAAFHLVMGLVHGLTNLGGAMLSVLANATHTDKHRIRDMISHY